MYVDKASAWLIESAEALVMRDTVEALDRTARASSAFVRRIGPGVAVYVRSSSPLNKVIGAGIDVPIDDAALDEIEQAFALRGEPVRVELCTLADARTFAQLDARGYRLLGFENVLARSLGDVAPAPVTDIPIVHVTPVSLAKFRRTMVDAAAVSDDTGVPVDRFTRDVIDAAVDDSLHASNVLRYVAYRAGALAAAASMSLQRDIAVLTGSATLPAHRGQGVQSALIAARLADARAAGAALAIVTTAPGTRSQANVMRLGFTLIYARAVLVRGRCQ